jgi:hypothetical protein
MTTRKRKSPEKAKLSERPTRGKRGPKKGEGGRPEFVPTDQQRRQVKNMSGMGCSNESIATVLELSRNTLEKHFTRELKVEREKAKFNLRVKQYEMAMAGNARMLEHLGKHWLDQIERKEIDITHTQSDDQIMARIDALMAKAQGEGDYDPATVH